MAKARKAKKKVKARKASKRSPARKSSKKHTVKKVARRRKAAKPAPKQGLISGAVQVVQEAVGLRRKMEGSNTFED